MHEWDPDALFEKAKVYADRAFREERDGSWFGLWMAVALEFLGRSVLAHQHPSLLANPNDPENILYACGIGRPKAPRSVGAKAVFRRCQMLVSEFTVQEFDMCLSLIERRNQELHSAGVGFADFPNSVWLRDYYRVIGILLSQLKCELADFLPGTEVASAQKMLQELSAELKGQVHKKRNEARLRCKAFSSEELKTKRAESAAGLAAILRRHDHCKVCECPVCESDALLTGEIISVGDPVVSEGAIEVHRRILPTRFKCNVCGLVGDTYQELDHLGLGGHFVTRKVYDPLEFHNIDLEHFAEAEGYIRAEDDDPYLRGHWDYDNE